MSKQKQVGFGLLVLLLRSSDLYTPTESRRPPLRTASTPGTAAYRQSHTVTLPTHVECAISLVIMSRRERRSRFAKDVGHATTSRADCHIDPGQDGTSSRAVEN
jgi:hypothetical protein